MRGLPRHHHLGLGVHHDGLAMHAAGHEHAVELVADPPPVPVCGVAGFVTPALCTARLKAR
jgi:hypothetical protein